MDSGSAMRARQADDSIAGRVSRRKRSAEEESPSVTMKTFFPARKLAGLQDEKRAKGDSKQSAVCTPLVPQLSPEVSTPSTANSDAVPSVQQATPPCNESLLLVDSLGFFAKLSKPCLQQFIHSMPFGLLVTFSQLSREWSFILREYAISISCRSRFLSDVSEYHNRQMSSEFADCEDPFTDFGALLKAVTICMPTRNRVTYFMDFMETIPSYMLLFCGWNNFIRAFTKKWAYNEIEKLVERLMNMGSRSLRSDLNKVVQLPPGSNNALEMEVRSRLHSFLTSALDGQRDAGFWIGCILNTQPSVERKARVLMIMFAPVVDDCIAWRILIDESVDNWADCENRLKPLADAMASLLFTRDCPKMRSVYREAEVFQLIEEITTFPDPWSFDNFAVLLALRRPLLTLSVAARCRHAMYAECGAVFIRLKTLLRRWGIDVLAVLTRSLIGATATLTQQQRRNLVDAIYAAFTTSYRESLQLRDDGAAAQEEHESMRAMRTLLLELANTTERP